MCSRVPIRILNQRVQYFLPLPMWAAPHPSPFSRRTRMFTLEGRIPPAATADRISPAAPQGPTLAPVDQGGGLGCAEQTRSSTGGGSARPTLCRKGRCWGTSAGDGDGRRTSYCWGADGGGGKMSGGPRRNGGRG